MFRSRHNVVIIKLVGISPASPILNVLSHFAVYNHNNYSQSFVIFPGQAWLCSLRSRTLNERSEVAPRLVTGCVIVEYSCNELGAWLPVFTTNLTAYCLTIPGFNGWALVWLATKALTWLRFLSYVIAHALSVGSILQLMCSYSYRQFALYI